MTDFEMREELLAAARVLLALLKQNHDTVQTAVRALLNEAERLLPKAADEVEAGEQKTTKILTYGKRGRGTVKAAPEAEYVEERVLSTAEVLAAMEKQQKPAKKAKQKRKPLSEERKAQLRETLKKARAARAKK